MVLGYINESDLSKYWIRISTGRTRCLVYQGERKKSERKRKAGKAEETVRNRSIGRKEYRDGGREKESREEWNETRNRLTSGHADYGKTDRNNYKRSIWHQRK